MKKSLIFILALLICLAMFGCYASNDGAQTMEPAKSSVPAESTPSKTPQPSAQNTVAQQTPPQIVLMEDKDYPLLLKGALTKDELMFVLLNVPELPLNSKDYMYIINRFFEMADSGNGAPKTVLSPDSRYPKALDLGEVNRLFSVFGDYKLEEGGTLPPGVEVSDGFVYFVPAELSYEADIDITSAELKDDEIIIDYLVTKDSYELGKSAQTKTALLKKQDDGKYKIITISLTDDIAQSSDKPTVQSSPIPKENIISTKKTMSFSSEVADNARQAAFTHALKRGDGLEFSNSGKQAPLEYFICDINADGTQDLILGAVTEQDVFEAHEVMALLGGEYKGSYTLKPAQGSFISTRLFIPADKNGILSAEYNRGTGEVTVYRVTATDGTIKVSDAPEATFTMFTDEEQEFYNSVSEPQWIAVAQ